MHKPDKEKFLLEIYKEAIETFGPVAQEDKLVEESAELIQAIMKNRLPLKYGLNKSVIINEIADVENTLAQLKLIYNVNELELLDIKFKKALILEGKIKEYKTKPQFIVFRIFNKAIELFKEKLPVDFPAGGFIFNKEGKTEAGEFVINREVTDEVKEQLMKIHNTLTKRIENE